MPGDVLHERDRDVPGFVPDRTLEEVAERYAEHLVIRRVGGVAQVLMHTDHGPARFSRGLLGALSRGLHDVAEDRTVDAIVIGGAGDAWIVGVEPASFASSLSAWHPDVVYEQLRDGVRLLEVLALDVDVPTVAAVSGPGPRIEMALLCDLTIVAHEVVVADGNVGAGSIPGDGLMLVLVELVGPKRAAAIAYGQNILTAQEALALGVVTEVLPAREVLPRAMQLASELAARPRMAGRLTHQLVTRPWQRRVVEELRGQYAQQLLAGR